MKGFRFISILIGILILALPMISPAGESEQEEAFSIIKLDEIVVTATKTGKKALEVPQQVTIVTSEEITKSGYTNVTEYLFRVSGISPADYMGAAFGSQIRMRGFPERQSGPGITYQVNGITVRSTSEYGTSILNSIPIDSIDHIEIMKGPGSSLYGGRAQVGVFNIILKEGSKGSEFNVTGGYRSYDQKLIRVSVLGHEESFHYNIGASHSSGDFYWDEQKSNYNSLVLYPTFDIGDSSTLSLIVNYSDRNLDNAISYFTPEQIAEDRKQNNRCNEFSQENLFVGSTFEHNFTNRIRLSTFVGYIHEEFDAEATAPWGYKSDSELDAFVVEPRINFNLGENHLVTAGMSFEQEDGSTDLYSGYYDYDATIDNWGFYIQDEWKIVPSVTITAGCRYDLAYTDVDDRATEFYLDNKKADAFSPRGGISWEVVPDVFLFANVGRGFRVPNNFEYTNNKDLDPEYSNNYEAGAKAILWKRWETTLVGYYYEFEDLIQPYLVYNPTTGETDRFYHNAGKAEFKGVEWENRLYIGEQWTLYGNIGLDFSEYNDYKTDYDDLSGKKPAYVWRDKYQFGIEWRFRGLMANFDGRYFNDYYSEDSNDYKADNYFVADVGITYRYENWQIAGKIFNVFDEEYTLTSYRDMDVPAPETEGMLLLTMYF